MPTVEELPALDLLTLTEHTERAGDHIDPLLHATSIEQSLAISKTCEVRRNGELVAYAMLNQVSGSSWFVRGFNTHPAHRTAPVIRDLLLQVGQVAQQEEITELRSNVYKTNRLSMQFHRRLGFQVTKENAKGVEFFATVKELASNLSIERTSLGKPVAASLLER